MTAPNPPATIPATTVDQRYRMGPLLTEDPLWDFWWNTQLPDGTQTLAGEPVGWEGLQYILPLDQVGGRDGAFTGPQSVAPKQLEVEAMLVAPTESVLRSNLARLRQILGPQTGSSLPQPVVWEQYDQASGLRLALVTRPSGDFTPVVVSDQAATVKFTLVAANPVWKYQGGPVESAQVGLLDPGAIQGRTYSKTFNYTYGSGGSPGGEMTIVNNGNIDAWAVFYVTGLADNPIISNVTTAQDFQVLYTVPAGSTVRVDGRSGVVDPPSIRLAGRPFRLQPGANTIRWRTESGAYDSGALLRVEWRSTFS